jgi:DNA-binding transcriptional MerR regulator
VHLKVGELARHTGLTIRTLHHYDEIGLLRPSARSDAGYRLYSSADVARLHGIQALRHLGIGLKEIGSMLGSHGASMPGIIDKQIRALDHEIAHATELRARLALLQGKLNEGGEPDMDEWLGTLALMSTYGKYFNAAELKKIFENYRKIKHEWPPLFKAMRGFIDRGLPPDSVEIQPVVQRWMNLMVRWMDGDLELMSRWGQMHEREPGTRTKDAPDLQMIHYVNQAIATRMAVLGKYFDVSQLVRIGRVDDQAIKELSQAVRALIRRSAPVNGAAAQAQVRKWLTIMAALNLGDPAMARKLAVAYRDEPLLRNSSLLDPEVRDYLLEAQAAGQKQVA